MKTRPKFDMRPFFSVLALAAMLGLVAPGAAQADADRSANVSCLTYLSQFQGAVPYYAGAPGMPEAQELAAKGRSLCLEGNEAEAKTYLTQALREIGLTPKGIDAPPSPGAVQKAGEPTAPANWRDMH